MRALILILALGACYDNRTPYGPDGGAPPSTSCFPNLDGQLVRDEMPTQLGTAVSYLVAEDTNVNLSPGALDLRAEIAGERKLALLASPLGNAWFANDFPSASIVVPVDARGENLAVLLSEPSAVRLLGLVSTLPEHTLLIYQDPIDLYRFPLSVGQSWDMESAVTGTLAAVPYNGRDRYQVSVDEIAALALPHLRFTHAYRIHTAVTSDSGAAGVVVTRQQLSVISECFGEVTRVVSQDNESRTDFSDAAELWRFSL